MLGDFALFLSLPSLRHMAQVPIAPLAAYIQAVLQDPPAQPDAQPDALAFQPVALQADGPQSPSGNQLAAVQPAAEAPAQGAAQPAGLPDLVGSIYFLFHSLFFVSCRFWFTTCLVAFYPLALVFFLFIQIYSSPVVCASHVAGVLSRLLPCSNFVLVCFYRLGRSRSSFVQVCMERLG